VLTKRTGEDASRSIMFLHAPPQVAGVGFLQWVEPGQPNRQWLYLPALKRTRQISGGSRSESFVGTDFSYEDLAIMGEALDWSEREAPASVVGEATLDGHVCDVIELRPTEAADVTYGAIRLWLGRDDQVVHQYEFRAADGTVEKTLLLGELRDVDGIPTPHRMEMRNERSGSHTVVQLTEVKYNNGLADEVFTQRRLERGI
jgi:outer membrane lipoprotein-sorting protein